MITIRPKQPFFDWVQRCDYDSTLTLEDVREDPAAYLIPEFEDDEEQAEVMKWIYDDIFEAQLESWYPDRAMWPSNRDLKMFLEWFDIEFHSLVFDLLDEPIEVVDYGPDDPDAPIDPRSNGH